MFILFFMHKRPGPVQNGRLAEFSTLVLFACQFKKNGLQLQLSRISSTVAAYRQLAMSYLYPLLWEMLENLEQRLARGPSLTKGNTHPVKDWRPKLRIYIAVSSCASRKEVDCVISHIFYHAPIGRLSNTILRIFSARGVQQQQPLFA